MEKIKLTNEDIKTLVKETVQKLRESMYDEEYSSPVQDLNYMVERLAKLHSYLSSEQQKFQMVYNDLMQKISAFSNGKIINSEANGSELTFSVQCNQEMAKQAILSNNELLQHITSLYGDYEGQNIQEMLNDETEFVQIFDSYLAELFDDMNGYSISAKYYKFMNGLEITIDGPFNWEKLENINEIMDF